MSYESDDPSTRLARVRAAIDRCLDSQEYYAGSRRQRMAELRDLRKLEKELMDEVAVYAQGDSMASLCEVAPLR